MKPMFRVFLLLACCVALWAAPATARAEPSITVELNKLETVDKGCRVYMVFTNAAAVALASYKPDLVFFGKDGVIAERLVVEGGPLPAGKTKVKLFDIVELGCASIGRVLLNDIRACDGDAMAAGTCLAITATATRTKIEFVK
jgi:hypothetical protein